MNKASTRRCNLTVHGGRAVCVEDEIKEWFQLCRDDVDWKTAKSECEKKGGHLFYALNGSYSQIEVIHLKKQKEGGGFIWLGITEYKENEFENVKGENVPRDMLTLKGYRGPFDAHCIAIYWDNLGEKFITERLGCHYKDAYFCDLSPLWNS